MSLFKNEHEYSSNFFENIRSVNSSLSFAVLKTTFGSEYKTRGCPVVKINGLYHFLTPTQVKDAGSGILRFSQLYFVDSNDACVERASHKANKNINIDLLDKLDVMFRECNVYCKVFRNMYTFVKSDIAAKNIESYNLFFKKPLNPNNKKIECSIL